MFGRDPRLPQHWISGKEPNPQVSNNYQETFNKVVQLHDTARIHLDKYREKMKARHDLKTTSEAFDIGQQVCWNKKKSGWKNGFKVVERAHLANYVIEDENDKERYMVHESELKKDTAKGKSETEKTKELQGNKEKEIEKTNDQEKAKQQEEVMKPEEQEDTKKSEEHEE